MKSSDREAFLYWALTIMCFGMSAWMAHEGYLWAVEGRTGWGVVGFAASAAWWLLGLLRLRRAND